jgi:hypothetical protein
MKKRILLSALVMMSFVLAQAQVQTPSASPAASVSTQVGLTDIKIDYFRPSVKGRTIFGDEAGAAPAAPAASSKKKATTPAVPAKPALVPYGKLWRTGANNGTKITFSDDVKVEGIAVPKGEYLIFSWPGANEWTISLYKDIRLGGNTNDYNAAQEAAKFTVKPERLAEKVETLTFNIGDISADNKTAKVQMAWENTSVKFNVAVDYESKVMKSIEANTRVNPYNYFQAAVYYLENGKDLNQALEWVNKAAEGMGNPFWVLYQKARIQKALGDKEGALATANASLESAIKEKNRDYQMNNEELIKSLK